MNGIRDILRDLNIPFKEHSESSLVTEGWVGIVCPMPGCGQGGKFGRGIHVQSLKSTCWKCSSARIGDVLVAASGRPLRDILALLSGMAPRFASDERTPSTGRYTPPEGVGPLEANSRRYLAKRGLDPDQCAEMYNLGWIGLSKMLKFRIFMPVCNPNGVPVSWTTRAIGEGVQPRYLMAPPEQESRPLKSLLFGEHLALHSVCVVEGQFDAIRLGPGAVATGGLVVTKAQVNRIAKHPVRYICFDNEPMAQKRAVQLAESLSVFPGETNVIRLSTGKDPGDAAESEIKEIRSLLT